MRKPTRHEQHLLKNALSGLKTDIDILSDEESLKDALKTVSYYDILGTLGVNIGTVLNIHARLRDEEER